MTKDCHQPIRLLDQSRGSKTEYQYAGAGTIFYSIQASCIRGLSAKLLHARVQCARGACVEAKLHSEAIADAGGGRCCCCFLLSV